MRGWVIVLLVCIYAFCWAILAELREWRADWEQHHAISDPPKDTRPVIPECDKKLWDKIRGECNDS